MTSTQERRIGGLETRSIDYVPLDERHGKIWHLGPLWFMSNAQIATLAVGLISITTGGDLFWSVVSIVVGTLVGTLFMAFHSAQGPQLGLPQMIQSRPQFGYVGALLVWLFAYVQYAGFNVFNSVLAGDSMHVTAHGSAKLWITSLEVQMRRLRSKMWGRGISGRSERSLRRHSHQSSTDRGHWERANSSLAARRSGAS